MFTPGFDAEARNVPRSQKRIQFANYEDDDEEEYVNLQEEKKGLAEYRKAANDMINSIGLGVWQSSKRKFHHGDSYKMMFIEEDKEDEPSPQNGKINLFEALAKQKQDLQEKQETANRVNHDLNRTELQHMDSIAGIDKQTRRTIRDMKVNIDQDRSVDKESGNTLELVKKYSRDINDKITQDIKFKINTVLVADDSGDAMVREELLSDYNIGIANNILQEEGQIVENKGKLV
jgi:hypothetical protein